MTRELGVVLLVRDVPVIVGIVERVVVLRVVDGVVGVVRGAEYVLRDVPRLDGELLWVEERELPPQLLPDERVDEPLERLEDPVDPEEREPDDCPLEDLPPLCARARSSTTKLELRVRKMRIASLRGDMFTLQEQGAFRVRWGIRTAYRKWDARRRSHSENCPICSPVALVVPWREPGSKGDTCRFGGRDSARGHSQCRWEGHLYGWIGTTTCVIPAPATVS